MKNILLTEDKETVLFESYTPTCVSLGEEELLKDCDPWLPIKPLPNIWGAWFELAEILALAWSLDRLLENCA